MAAVISDFISHQLPGQFAFYNLTGRGAEIILGWSRSFCPWSGGIQSQQMAGKGKGWDAQHRYLALYFRCPFHLLLFIQLYEL